jgi:hypothetical protein
MAGTVGIKLDPQFLPRDGLHGVRYRLLIEEHVGQPKLLFSWAQIGTPRNGAVVRPGHQAIECCAYPYSWKTRDDAAHGWPPTGALLPMPAVYGVAAVSEYTGHPTIGIARAHGALARRDWPRQSAGVDGMPGCNKIGVVGQRSIIGVPITVTIELVRLETVHQPSKAWSWRQLASGEWTRTLPRGEYALWHLTITGLAHPMWVPIRTGADWGTVIDPNEALAFLTEFFDSVGAYRARISDIGMRPVDSALWFPARNLHVHYGAPGPTYGIRVEGSSLVLEHGTGLYLGAGERVRLGT